MITAICPGSYDPVTFGHVDVIARASAIFDRVVVGVVGNPQHKSPMFTLDERVAFLREALEAGAQEADPLVEGEHRRLVLRVADDADDDAVEDLGGASDHVDVPVRDGVVRAGVDRGDHSASKSVRRAEP